LSAAAGKVIGAVGFAVSVLMMAGVAGLGAVLSISMGAWLFVRHPRRVRGVRNGRLRIWPEGPPCHWSRAFGRHV